MKKILILTVGGSCEPLIKAIKNHSPDFVYFVCSKDSRKVVDGKGNPCSGKSSIVDQTDLLSETFCIIELSDPDELGVCYREITAKIKEDLRNRFPEHPLKVIANYTGGTKTMSVTLALAALNMEDWDLEFNRGPRTDLVKIRTGDIPVLMDKWEVYAHHQWKLIENFWQKFYYAEAAEFTVKNLQIPLSPKMKNRFFELSNISLAFDAWDRFNHQSAYELLRPFGKYFPELIKVLAWLVQDANPYLKVFDLIRNAERRAAQKRFDDAIARLYRAVELLAQIRIHQQYNLETGNFPFQRLPVKMQKFLKDSVNEKGYVKLGLIKAYYFLASQKDLLGEFFKKQEKEILNALKKRNYSILAHGLEAIDESIYKESSKILINFLKKGLALLKQKMQIPQLPQKLPFGL